MGAATQTEHRPASARGGRRRPGAAARVGTYTAPAGWRSHVPRELVAVSRPAAVAQLVTEVAATADEPGLSERVIGDVTRVLAGRTDRGNGLVIGASLDALAATSGWSRATVRRVIAFLVRIGRLCRVGAPLSARVLGTDRGLTPVYAWTRPRRTKIMSTPPHPEGGREIFTPHASARETSEGYRSRQDAEPFGKFDVPRTRRDRKAATARFLAELGLTGRVSTPAAASALALWWRQGWCVAGLLFAVHYRPGDAPEGFGRGCASNGSLPADPKRPRQVVRDELRLILWRLTWWYGCEPPAHVRGVDRAARLTARARTADTGRTEPAASESVRADRMAAIRAVLGTRKSA